MALSLVMLQDILFTPRASFMSKLHAIICSSVLDSYVCYILRGDHARAVYSDYEDFDLKKEEIKCLKIIH